MNDSQYIQEQFVGKTFTQKLNSKMADYFEERKFRELGFIPRPGAIAMVHTLENGAIKSVGASAPQDIINNNFGKWLAAMHTIPSTTLGTASLSEIGGAGGGSPPVRTDGDALQRPWWSIVRGDTFNSGSRGETYIQIGLGFNTPLVDDFDIETAFPDSPEADKTLTPDGGYSPTVGRVQVGVNIGPTTGTGTVRELGIFQDWQTLLPAPSGGFYMLSHDEISPGVDFIVGETLFCQYFWQL